MKTKELVLTNMSGVTDERDMPEMVVIEYQDDGINVLAGHLTKVIADTGAMQLQLNYNLKDFITKLSIKKYQTSEPQAINLADWDKRSLLTFIVRPDGSFGIMIESHSANAKFHALYTHTEPLYPTEPSRIMYPH